MAAALTDVFSTNLYLIIIGKMYSIRDAGFYDRAQRTQQLPIMVMMGIINRVAFSVFSMVAEDRERLARGLRRAQALSMFMHLPIMVGIIILARPIVLVLFGPQWLSSVPILQVLGLGGLFWPMHVLNLTILKAQGRADLFFWITICKKTLTISLTVAASFYGVMAIAWMLSAVSLLTYFVNTHYTGKFLAYGGWRQLSDLAANFLSVIPMAVAVYFMVAKTHVPPFVQLVLGGILGGAIYLLTCRLMCEKLLNECLQIMGIGKRAAQIS